MKTLARHLIGELYEADLDVISSIAEVRLHMLDAAEIIGATVVAEAFHRFEPQGVSGSVVIAESHLSIHTWPESRYVAVDIFTCGGLDPRPGLRLLQRRFRASSVRTQEIIRGLPDHIEAGKDLLPDDVELITRVASSREA